MLLDILIINGSVIDGTGKLRYQADVGIVEGRIEIVGKAENLNSTKVIDASGLIISPGFIDMHTHSDLTLLDDPGGDSKIHQGVTTEVVGNCGYSPFPVGPDGHGILNRSPNENFDWNWRDLDGWASQLESQGVSMNVAPQLGHGSIRKAARLTEDRCPSRDELKTMRSLVEESIEQGAFSMSTGLTGAPGMYADTDEIVALAEVMSGYDNAFYVTHARVWGGNHIGAIQEAMDIGFRAQVPVQFSHMAIIDPRAYGDGEQMIDVIEKARSDGLDATYDVYPYTAAGSGLAQSLPSWLQVGGDQEMLRIMRTKEGRKRALLDMKKGHFRGLPWDFDSVVIAQVGSKTSENLIGKSVEEIAKDRKADPIETYLDLVDEEDNKIGAVFHNRVESDVVYFLTHELAMIGSDGNAISPVGAYSRDKPHPRFYGTHPRVLGRYVREKSYLSLECAIQKMTNMPATRLGLKNRGTIERNYMADLVVFDPDKIVDTATFDDPHNLAEGISYVIVGGEIVVSKGKHTNAKPGRVLRRGE